jgi:hypothetical protein
VSDPLMSRDHLRGFSSRSASIKADSAAACCHRLGSARRPRERLAPRLEDATERAGIEMRCGAILSDVRQPDAVESRTNDKVQIVHDEPPLHRNVND